jgi:hypothetical protein
METYACTHKTRKCYSLEGHVEEVVPCDFLPQSVYRVYNNSRYITFQDDIVNTTNNIAFTKNEKENKFPGFRLE